MHIGYYLSQIKDLDRYLIYEQKKPIKLKIFFYFKKKIGYKGYLKAESKRVRPEKSEVDKLLCDNRLFVKQFKWKHKVLRSLYLKHLNGIKKIQRYLKI